MSYYTEGTIDSIGIEANECKLKQFTLLPSSAFLITMPDGKKKAIFIEDSCNNAGLVDSKKNAEGKDVVMFNAASAGRDIADILTQAKRDRMTLRIFARPKKNWQDNAESYPNIDDVIEIHLI